MSDLYWHESATRMSIWNANSFVFPSFFATSVLDVSFHDFNLFRFSVLKNISVDSLVARRVSKDSIAWITLSWRDSKLSLITSSTGHPDTKLNSFDLSISSWKGFRNCDFYHSFDLKISLGRRHFREFDDVVERPLIQSNPLQIGLEKVGSGPTYQRYFL